MDPNQMYAQMEARLAAWAQSQADVRAVIVIGSRARADHPADAWSDLDTILFVDDAAPYASPGRWSTELVEAVSKTTWFAAFDRLTENEVEWEYIFDDGSKLDLVFSPNRSPQGKHAALAERVAKFPFRNVLIRGMRVLVDKTNSAPVTLEPPAAPSLPDAGKLERAVNTVLLDMYRAWKLAGRGELWRAARVVNYQVHDALLPLVGWHAHAVHEREPGPYGRFMEEWADPNVLALLEGAYAKNTRESILRALQNAHRLLKFLVVETAQKCDLYYPAQAMDKMELWLE